MKQGRPSTPLFLLMLLTYNLVPKPVLAFTAPPTSVNQFIANICQGILYEGYNPFNASNSYTSRSNAVVMKAKGYAYFSASINTVKSVFGNRCSFWVWTGQIKINKSNPQRYAVQFGTLLCTCDVDVMCAAPYAFDNTSYRPLPKDSPIPFVIYGFESTKTEHIMNGSLACVETSVNSFSSWDKPPFNLNNLKGATFELFVDEMSKRQAIISD
jgi:hypothetical protein